MSVCTIRTCTRTVLARGWCRNHYYRWRRNGDPEAVRNTRWTPAHFWAKVEKSEGCWVYVGARHRFGYGKLTRNRVTVEAHRVSWELAYGPIPAGLSVLHRCDNPPCVRPEHLFLGTQADNLHDMDAKGRRGKRGRFTAAEQ